MRKVKCTSKLIEAYTQARVRDHVVLSGDHFFNQQQKTNQKIQATKLTNKHTNPRRWKDFIYWICSFSLSHSPMHHFILCVVFLLFDRKTDICNGMNQPYNTQKKQSKEERFISIILSSKWNNNKKNPLISELAIERLNLQSPSVRNLRIFAHITPFY